MEVQRQDGSGFVSDDDPVHEIDGILLKRIFISGLHWLEERAPSINALNVFPVPDGDTGTNMLLTMRSAIAAVAENTSLNAAEVAERLARGAMMGARGNSGVILSQILRGFAAAVTGKDCYTVHDMAAAFRRASDSAYRAVMKPIEGTILTVVRALADEAEKAAHETEDIRELLGRATKAATEALMRTPDMLPVLKEAGVVDSGGQGLVTLLEGMIHSLWDRNSETEEIVAGETIPTGQALLELHAGTLPPTLGDGRYGYDIQFLIQGDNLDLEAIRTHISSLGDCPLVIGDRTMVKVHVHCLTPGPALDYGAALGMLDDIVVENMDLQFESFVHRDEGTEAKPSFASGYSGVVHENLGMYDAPDNQSNRDDATKPDTVTATHNLTSVGIVAVAMGDGFQQIFRALGVSAIVAGGQSMNPSTQDLLEAIQEVDAEAVILLPNNKNVALAAQQARQLSDRPVFVVPTTTVPQGLAALMGFDFSADGQTNAALMAEEMTRVVSAEITTAARTATVNDLAIQEGDTIGILDGRLVAAGADDANVIRMLFDRIQLEEFELVVLYYGAGIDSTEAQSLAGTLAQSYPSLDFQIHEGGQPQYHYIISIE